MGGRRALVAGIISFVAMGAALAPPSPLPRAEAAPSGFVTSNGDGLVLDGAPYRFTGINIYNANNTGGCWDPMSDATLGASLDAIGSGRVIRAWFFQSLATNGGARDWTSFDRTLAFAASRGMKVIPTLGNQWGACDGANGSPGLDKDEAWYSGGYTTSTQPGSTVAYRDWVAEIVTRYATDPTVLAWQLMNEAEVKPVVGDGLPCSAGAANILRDFAEDVSGLVKTIDPDHLVSLGTIGGGQCGTSFEEYAFVHDVPTIDVCEYHDYGAPNQSFPGDEFNGLAKRVAQCDALNKPLIIGESGIRPTAAGGSLEDRADVFRTKLSDQLAAGIDGVALWAWNPAGSTLGDYDIGPGDPVLPVLASVLVFSVSSASPNAQARGVSHVAVTITGTGFVTGSTALFPGGGVTVHSTTFVDAAHLSADISITNAAALGARDVRVTKPGSPTTNTTCVGCFTVSAKPTITSLSPTARPQGASNQTVTITGTGFASNAVVTFEGTGITVNAVSGGGTSLVLNVSVSVSAAVGPRNVTVTNPDGGVVTKANGFTVSATPTLTSTVPGGAVQGRTLNVQVLGSAYPANFTTGGTVSFGPSITVNTVTRNSATKLTVNVTIGAAATLGPRDVSVTNPDGASVTCSSCFAVTAPPTVESLAPSSRGQGASHQLIVVTGTGFQTGVKASIVGGGVTIHSVTVADATSLTLDVSVAGAAIVGTRDVVVTNPDTGTVTCVGCFTVNPKPTIANTSPSSRPAGGSYTIAVNGTSFQSGAAVSFSGTGIQVNSVSGSGTVLNVTITIASDATIANRAVTVTNPDGSAATKTNGFRVLARTAPPPSTTTLPTPSTVFPPGS